MKIAYHPRFGRMFKKLSRDVQERALLREEMFRKDPFDPRLKTHKLHGSLADYWGFWIDSRNRIIFKFAGKNEIYFYKIGNHSIYE